MPYELRKTNNKKPWCVFNTETGENKGCSETEEQGKKHLAVLNMREHGVPPKSKEETMTEETSAGVTLPQEYIDRLQGITDEIQKVTGTPPPTGELTPPAIPQPALPPETDDVEEPQEAPDEEIVEKDEADEDVVQYLAGIESVFPGASAIEKAQGEREKLQAAAEARAKRYGIGVKEGGNRTPPKGYPSAESEYGDPVNYRYPADAGHARPALGYFNHEGQQAAGGYTSKEWAVIGGRLARLISRHLTGSYTYSNGKLQQAESKAEEKDTDMLTQMKIWLKDIWDRLVGSREESITPFFVTKAMADGTHRWIKVSSTAFRDREQEIVSTEGVAKSIARADESSQYGPLLFWHEPIPLGSCDFQAQDGVCLVESGLWDSTPTADAARKSIDDTPSSWGVSIGFLPLASQEGAIIKGAKVNRLWTDLQIVERSILPSSQAASLFTQSIVTRGDTMEQKKKDALLELLGNDEDLVEKVLSATKDINQKAEEPDAVFKDTSEPPPEGEQVEPSEETKDVEENAEEQDADLLIMLKSLREQVETLSSQVTALQATQEAPKAALHRPTVPSEAGDETPTEDTETKDIGVPRVVTSITSKLLGG